MKIFGWLMIAIGLIFSVGTLSILVYDYYTVKDFSLMFGAVFSIFPFFGGIVAIIAGIACLKK